MVVEVDGDDGDAFAHLTRIFSLDVDGSGFHDVGERDPVLGRLQTLYPGLRPVLFWSPYEAAAWAVISQRVRMAQAVRLKQQMTREAGESVEVHGQTLLAFPSPSRLIRTAELPGLPAAKTERLHGVARAALDGRLDAGRLRATPRRQALDELKEIPGVGDFSAELILVRGAGDPDHFPRHERWRPYRSWASLLLRTALEGRVEKGP